jgi:hypothetical protein
MKPQQINIIIVMVPLHKQFYKWEKLDACVLASAKRA